VKETPRVQVTVDHTRCVGSASCVSLAPGVFALDKSRLSIVTDPGGEPLARVLGAADQCPTQAISVVASALSADAGEEGEPDER
jgi:ferredoxin